MTLKREAREKMHLDFFFGMIILFLKYLILSSGAISGFDLAFRAKSSFHSL